MRNTIVSGNQTNSKTASTTKPKKLLPQTLRRIPKLIDTVLLASLSFRGSFHILVIHAFPFVCFAGVARLPR